MSENNDSANYTSDDTQREHNDGENPRFGRGRRGNQEENNQNQDPNTDQQNDNSKGQTRDSNKSDSGSGKNNQNNQENFETSPENPAPSEDENQDETSNEGDKPDNNSGQNNESDENGGGRDNESDGHGRDDQSEDGRWRDSNSDGRSEREEFDEEEECERDEPEENGEECDQQKPELDQQGNPNYPHRDFSDDGDHSDHGGPNHHLPPPGAEVPSSRPGFMERASAYTITFSNETMFEVLLGSMLILVSAVFLFIYMIKRQRRKTMRSQSPIHFVTPNQNIATSNFYQYYQKEGFIPTGTVVGYIPEGHFLQPGAKNSANLKSFGRLPTQDEILDLS